MSNTIRIAYTLIHFAYGLLSYFFYVIAGYELIALLVALTIFVVYESIIDVMVLRDTPPTMEYIEYMTGLWTGYISHITYCFITGC